MNKDERSFVIGMILYVAFGLAFAWLSSNGSSYTADQYGCSATLPDDF